MKNLNTLFLAIGVAAILAVTLAPLLASEVSADKDKICTNGGGKVKECGSPPANEERCENPKGKTVSCGEGFDG